MESLYTNAHTQIMINGVLSAPMRVYHRMRQGDPISSFTFDLTIEPLACVVRESPKLQGYMIPNVKEKVLINLFADDTTIYLGINDRYNDLKGILDTWCSASGAKFNTMKTEIIPIGSLAHRNRVNTTCRLHPADEPLNPNIHIAQDSQAI